MFWVALKGLATAAAMTICAVFFPLTAACFADTVVMVDGNELECTVLGEDDDRIEVEVEFGTIQILKSRILRIEKDDPEIKARKEAEKKARAEAAAKFAEEQRAKGLVPVDGEWVTPAEAARMEEARRRRAEEAAKKAAASQLKTESKEKEEDKEKAEEEKAAKKGKEATTALQEELMRYDRGHRKTSRHGTSRSSRSTRSRGSYGRGSSIYSGNTLYGRGNSSGSRTGVRNHYYGDLGTGALSSEDRARIQQLLNEMKGDGEGD